MPSSLDSPVRISVCGPRSNCAPSPASWQKFRPGHRRRSRADRFPTAPGCTRAAASSLPAPGAPRIRHESVRFGSSRALSMPHIACKADAKRADAPDSQPALRFCDHGASAHADAVPARKRHKALPQCILRTGICRLAASRAAKSPNSSSWPHQPRKPPLGAVFYHCRRLAPRAAEAPAHPKHPASGSASRKHVQNFLKRRHRSSLPPQSIG